MSNLSKTDILAIASELQSMATPHICMTCSWFKPKRTAPQKGMRFCTLPGKLHFFHGVCKSWILQHNVSLQVHGNSIVIPEDEVESWHMEDE